MPFASAQFQSRFLLQESTVGSPVSSITLSGIPVSFRDLLVEARLRSDRVASRDSIRIRVGNGSVDSGSNYSGAVASLVNSGNSGASGDTQDGIYTGRIAAGASSTGRLGVAFVRLWDYARAGDHRMIDVWGQAIGESLTGSLEWKNSSAAINVMSFVPVDGSNWEAGTVRLYGVR